MARIILLLNTEGGETPQGRYGRGGGGLWPVLGGGGGGGLSGPSPKIDIYQEILENEVL